MLTTLIKLGLSEKEAKVYLAALELSKDTVQNIAKKAGINRPITYVVLEKLMKMGLISSLEQGKKTYFVAEDPKELELLLEKQRREIDDKKNELKAVMNELSAIHNSRSDKPIVKYFEGEDGLLTMDKYGRNLMRKGSETIAITPVDLIEKKFPERRKQAISERVKLGVRSRTIYTHKDGPIDNYTNKKELREGLFVPRNLLPIDTTITVYPDWGVKIFYFGDNPYGVVIESKDIAKNMRVLLDLAWTGAKQIIK